MHEHCNELQCVNCKLQTHGGHWIQRAEKLMKYKNNYIAWPQ